MGGICEDEIIAFHTNTSFVFYMLAYVYFLQAALCL